MPITRNKLTRFLRTPAFIAFCYTIFTLLWIFLSSYAVLLTTDDAGLIRTFELLKGLMFALFTGLILYFLLRGWRQPSVPEETQESHKSFDYGADTKKLVAVFAALLLLLPLLAIVILSIERPHIEKRTLDSLQAVARLKAEQIENWFNERYSDGFTLSGDPFFIAKVSRLKQGDQATEEEVSARLLAFREAYHYSAVVLLDASGKILLRSGELRYPPPGKGASGSLSWATTDSSIHRVSVFRDAQGELYFHLEVPLTEKTDNRQIGSLIIQIEPGHFLFPYIEQWPTDSQTGETLLVRRKNESVQFINRPRYSDAEAMAMILPLSTADSPAAMALRGDDGGAYRGVDYRGAEVLAASRPVRGTGWQVITKQDRTEVMAPLGTLMRGMGMIGIFTISIVLLCLMMLWRQQQRLYRLAIAAEKNKTDSVLQRFFDLPFIGMAVTCPTTKRWLEFNDYLCEMSGYSREELRQLSWEDITHPEDLEKGRVEFARIRRGEIDQHTLDKRFVRKNGEVIFTTIDVKCVRKPNGEVAYFLATIKDISERRASIEQLQVAANVFEQSRAAIVITDIDDHVIMANAAFTEIFGYTEAEVRGRQKLTFLSDGMQDGAFFQSRRKVLDNEGSWAGEILSRRKDGTAFPGWLSMTRSFDGEGNFSGYIRVFEDTSLHKEQEDRIEWLAHFDPLTELPNRTLLIDRSTHAIRMAQRNDKKVAILYCDLDRFKNVNDTLGHNVGDKLLAEVARRLRGLMREEDTISRQGGDEFVILLYDTDAEAAAHVAEKVLAAISQPVIVDQYELSVSFSIGITVYPDDGDNFNTLAKYADLAMYRAKELGRGSYCFFTNELQKSTSHALKLEHDLRSAIDNEELFLCYQPQIAVASNKIVGVEALLRWQHPELGMVSPIEFIPIAEYSGQILAIGEWVLRSATRQLKSWIDSGLTPLKVAVNLSVRQLREPRLFEKLVTIISDSGLEPGLLQLELTESMLMEDQEQVIDTLHQIRSYGINLAIDDFGTGYSSLSYLKRLPIDCLKIDKSFINDMLAQSDDAIIARSIIAMGHSLGLNVIAEGVENSEQLEFLRAHQCDQVQGYFFSKPLPAPEIFPLLENRNSMHSLSGDYKTQKLDTLLLVDDEPNVLDALERNLMADGYHLLKATDAAEALDILAMHKVSVIISDQYMPGMTGVEFLRRAKEFYPDTVRIIMSGHDNLETVAEAVNSGEVYRFIEKPCQPALLRATLREAFQYRSLLLEVQRLSRMLKEKERAPEGKAISK